MRGLDIAKEFYLQFGKPMLEEQFADVIDRIAIGLVGEGSECLGYDDEFSQDHDFEPGFCLWITKEDEKEFGFRLERAYAKLPKEFMGLHRSFLSPAGGNRHGVFIIDDFYTHLIGAASAPIKNQHWLAIPPFYLRSATNGEVFSDKLGKFTDIRNVLLQGYPEDVRKKKIAAHLALMAQSGQYNYQRCIARGEFGAAQLAIFEFVKNTLSIIYLLNKQYEPFYKWVYRGLKDLKCLGHIGESLQGLTEMDNSKENVKIKQEIIDDIILLIINELRNQNLSKVICNDLEKHAYYILDSIKDEFLRNMHIMEGI